MRRKNENLELKPEIRVFGKKFNAVIFISSADTHFFVRLEIEKKTQKISIF